MAVLNIVEFSEVQQIVGATMQIARDPIAYHNPTIGSETSINVSAACRYVRLKAGAACAVKWGVTATATTGNLILSDGDTEYFGVNPGDEISVITL